ncbi:MAG: ABC transporter ATP-binding protein [Gammaproteobacteria bacterium]
MLAADGLRKSYGSVDAVKSVSLAVQSGQMLALLGPNGAGKTTTIRMLVGLTPKDSGTIDYTDANGQQHDQLPSAEIGYLPEERGLYVERPVLEGLVYFGQIRGMSASAAATSAQHWLERFELWDRRDDKVQTLSKGNQQKVQFISAVVHGPRIAIIDEPFSGFDPLNQERMLRFLKELRDEGMAIVFSAHQMDLVQRLADDIILMASGEVVAAGKFEEISAQSGCSATIEARYDTRIDRSAVVNAPGEFDLDGDRIQLRPGAGHDLNEALTWLGDVGRIVSINARQPSLHEIYLEIAGAASP